MKAERHETRCAARGYVIGGGKRRLASYVMLIPALTMLFRASPSLSDTPDPCSALLCLAGALTGQCGGAGCSVSAGAYYAIKVFDPVFDPASTAAARAEYLNSCPGAALNAGMMAAIDEAFGPLFEGPDAACEPVTSTLPDQTPASTPGDSSGLMGSAAPRSAASSTVTAPGPAIGASGGDAIPAATLSPGDVSKDDDAANGSLSTRAAPVSTASLSINNGAALSLSDGGGSTGTATGVTTQAAQNSFSSPPGTATVASLSAAPAVR